MDLEVERPAVELTAFQCQGLLYEFVTGRLDSGRQAQIDAFLSKNPESRQELERLNRALGYTQAAAQVRIEEQFKQELLEFEPAWRRQISELTMWSSERGWKVLPYLFMTALLVVGVFAVKPWQMKVHQDVVLVEQNKSNLSATVKSNSPITPPNAPSPLIPMDKTDPTSAAPTSEVTTMAAAAGELTSAEMGINDFEAAWPQIKAKIESLGGHPAGQAELGFQVRPGEMNFHFSLPESKQDELKQFLKNFGPVRFNTTPHARVMPEGQVRIILIVRDNGGHEEKATAP